MTAERNSLAVGPRFEYKPPKKPIQFDVADTYEFTIDDGGECSYAQLAVAGALGHEGMKALDQFYASGKGKHSVPEVVRPGSNTSAATDRYFYRPALTVANTLIDAVVHFDRHGRTVLAFHDYELPWGLTIVRMAQELQVTRRQAQLAFISERIEYFLRERGVTSDFKKQFAPVPDC